MPMVAKIRPVGNSKGIILPQSVLAQLHGAIGEEVAEMELTVEAGRIVMVPHGVRYATTEQFQKSKRKLFARHSGLMKNLAKR